MPEYLLALTQGATRDAAAPIIALTAEALEEALEKGKVEYADMGLDCYAGIAYENGMGECARLFLATIRAEAQAEVEITRLLYLAASNGSVRAIGWLLERRFPERWGRFTRPEAAKASRHSRKRKPGLDDKTALDYRKKVLGIDQREQAAFDDEEVLDLTDVDAS